MVSRLSTALVGPNTLFREGLRRVLKPTHYHVKKVAEELDSIRPATEFDLILLIAAGDQAALVADVRRAKEESQCGRIVVMSDIDGPDTVWALLGAGADGYLLRKISLEALLASLDVVMLGGAVVPPMPRNAVQVANKQPADIVETVPPAPVPKVEAEPGSKRLSDRETDILLCLMRGESNKVIARKFDIAEATVKVHLKAILRKIHVSNRTQAAVWAHNNNLAQSMRRPDAGPGDMARADADRGATARIKHEVLAAQEESPIVAEELGGSVFVRARGASRSAI